MASATGAGLRIMRSPIVQGLPIAFAAQRHDSARRHHGVRPSGVGARLQQQTRVGLDTEFLRERTYRAQLCLVQLSSPTEAACVDPLALRDLSALVAVLTAAPRSSR